MPRTQATQTQRRLITLHTRANLFAAPSSNTTYFWGGNNLAPQTVSGLNLVRIPYAGRLVGADLQVLASGAPTASTHQQNAIIRINNTTDNTVFSSVVHTPSVTLYQNTTMSIAVVAGDYFEWKWPTPAWSTNPTNVFYSGNVYLERTF